MSGFRNITEYVDALESGQTWFSQFRKTVSSGATITGSYVDYTYFAGLPLANFYASTPLEAAEIDPTRGIYIPSVAPSTQFLHKLSIMLNAASSASVTAQLQKIMLCDYLMYYPFIDTDAVGEQQDMIQSITIPRYTGGKVLAISQSASSTIGQFTMTYTNQDGVSGRVSPNTFTQIVAGGGLSLMSDISGGGFNPFVPLQAGDSGISSIESVTFTAAGGGLMSLVIVKPLATQFAGESARAPANESFGAATEQESWVTIANAPQIKDGAILGFVSKGNAGSLASSALVGYIETVWN